MRSSSSGALSRPGGRWASAEATISLPTRAGTLSATAYATRPPRLKPNRSASAMPRWSSSATTSPASAWIVIGRPVSAVCPCPWELHRDHLPARRHRFEQRPEAEVDGHQATMEQHKRPPAAVDLVLELQA